MTPLTKLYLTDDLMEVEGLQNAADGTYMNTATTVSVTLVDATTRVNIVGETWPLTLGYITGSNGDYRGTLKSTLTLTKGQTLLALVWVDGGTGKRRYWELDVTVKTGKA